MTELQPSEVTTEESTDENRIVVNDPEDYQKTKKLKLIYDTKKEVVKTKKSRHDLIPELHNDYRASDPGEIFKAILAEKVSQYGSELLPLLEDGLDQGVLNEDDLEARVTPDHVPMDIVYFIQMDGWIQHPQKDERVRPPEPNTMAIYRQLGRVQRKLGLGLELEEDLGSANI